MNMMQPTPIRNGRLVEVARPSEARMGADVDAFGAFLPVAVYPDPQVNFRHAGLKQWVASRNWPVTLAASTTVFETVEIDPQWDFYAEMGICQSWRTDGTDTKEPSSRHCISVQIREFSNGRRNLTDGYTPFQNFFGSAQYPAKFEPPLVMPAGSQWGFEIVNDEAVPLALFFVFVGVMKEAGTR